uniref:Candidate secreted effector n=1 Tax=Meloidogyne incognita TaxID=6306 RepID=A0A914KIT6_MELIC
MHFPIFNTTSKRSGQQKINIYADVEQKASSLLDACGGKIFWFALTHSTTHAKYIF